MNKERGVNLGRTGYNSESRNGISVLAGQSSESLDLVILEDNSRKPITPTTTRLVHIEDSYTDKDTNRDKYDIAILSDESGNLLRAPILMYGIDEKNIGSARPLSTINNKLFYLITDPTNMDDIIVSGFTPLDSNKGSEITNTLDIPIGTGVFGYCASSIDAIVSALGPTIKSRNINYKEIDMNNPYIIQDQDHYYSLVRASNALNEFMDRMKMTLKKSNDDERRADEIALLFAAYKDQIEAMYILVTVLLKRTTESIAYDLFYKVLMRYLLSYTAKTSAYIDSYTGKYIFPLPINFVMEVLEHDGVIGDIKYMPISVSFNIAGANKMKASNSTIRK